MNKIKWDKRENPDDYSIFYFDRILNKLIKIPYAKIKRIEDNFMVLDNGEEPYVPLHRIKCEYSIQFLTGGLKELITSRIFTFSEIR